MGNILRSPIYAQSYPPNMHCVYNISVPQGKVQKLVFQIFELAFDPHCRYVSLIFMTTVDLRIVLICLIATTDLNIRFNFTVLRNMLQAYLYFLY